MAALTNVAYPGYSDPNNYSGVNSAVRSGGLITNPEQHEAVLALERTGRLGMTIFGLVTLPRDVLMLQDERSAKTKAPNVSSTTRTTSDEDRLLSKVDDGTITPAPVGPKQDGGGNGGPGGYDPPANDTVEIPPPDSAPVAAQTTFTTTTPSGAYASQSEAPIPQTISLPTPNLLGRGNAVYLGVISSSSSHIAGRNVSILT